MKLIKNSIQTPDGTILISSHRHDFNVHKDENGKTYGIDGGLDYSRLIGDIEDCKNLSVWINEDELHIDHDDFEIVRNTISWGSRGKNGDQPLKFIILKNMTDDHLHAIVNIYQGRIDPFYKQCFLLEIEYRKKLGIIIDEGKN